MRIKIEESLKIASPVGRVKPRKRRTESYCSAGIAPHVHVLPRNWHILCGIAPHIHVLPRNWHILCGIAALNPPYI